MANKTQSLTVTQILNASAKDKEYNLYDGDSLSLRIKPIGTKFWLFNYLRPITKKRANLSIGRYPDLSLAKARTKAIETRQLLAEGLDPKERRDTTFRAKQAELSNTLQAAFEDWFGVKKTSIKELTAKKLQQHLDKYLLTYLSKYPIAEITAPHAIKILQPVANQASLKPEELPELLTALN